MPSQDADPGGQFLCRPDLLAVTGDAPDRDRQPYCRSRNMAEWLGPRQKGMPGYEGHLNARVTTCATLLSTRAGYLRSWLEVASGEDQKAWPASKGFAATSR